METQKVVAGNKMKLSAAITLIFLSYNTLFVVAAHNETCSSDSKQANSKPMVRSGEFEIRQNSSIIDYLNPHIFENATLLDEIRDALRGQRLMVIHDAFVPEFADIVWEDLSKIQDWEYHEDTDEAGYLCK